jgi:hypothetical protein
MPQAPPTRILAASYYSAKDGMSSSLTLNNKGPNALDVTPVLFDLDGIEVRLKPVEVPGNSFVVRSIAELAGESDPLPEEGSLQVEYDGGFLELGAAVNITHLATSRNFDEQLVEPATMFASSQLQGAWWVPRLPTTAKLSLSNTSNDQVSVTLAAKTTASTATPIVVSLRGHETRLLDLQSGVLGSTPITAAGAVSISHSGSPGNVLSRMYVTDLGIGYSSAIDLVDPGNYVTSSLHGAGLRVASIAGDELMTYGVIHNRGTTASTVTAKIPYRLVGGATNTLTLTPVVVAAGQVAAFDLATLLNQVQRDLVASAGLELTYSTAPGTVIASVFTKSTSGTHVFRLPLVDAQAMPSSTGGYPWAITADSKTTVYVKNTDVAARQLEFHFDYAGGAFTLGLQTLGAGQVLSVDIKQLRDDQVEDEEEHVIPVDANKGQVYWSSVDDLKVFVGRAEQLNVLNATSSTYACVNKCPNSFVSGQIDPPVIQTDVGSVVPFRARETRSNSFGLPFLNNTTEARGQVTWSSSNDAWVSVGPTTGIATAHPAGSGHTVTITASWTACTRTSTGICGGESPQLLPCCITNCYTYSTTATFIVDQAEVNILLNGVQVTNLSTNTIVGKKINLTAKVTGAKKSHISSYNWSVAGSVVANYITSPNAGTVVPFNGSIAPTANFYWVNGSFAGENRSVSLTVVVFGVERSVAATFKVYRPTAVIVAEVGVVDVVYKCDERIMLTLGCSPNVAGQPGPGMILRRTVVMPSGFNGGLSWLNLIRSTYRTKIFREPQNGYAGLRFQGFGLDRGFPWVNLFADGSFHDAPGVFLDGGPADYASAFAEDDFYAYLMFKPSGADSIWVPLRGVNWLWRGRASRPPVSVFWGVDESFTYVSDDFDEVEHPEWSTHVPTSFVEEYFNP